MTTRSIVKLRNVDLGFDENNLFTGLLSLNQSTYPDSAMPLFYQQLSERLALVPGFQVATLATSLPGLGGMSEPIALDGTSYQRTQDQPIATHIGITPNYSATLGLSLLEGRNFWQRMDGSRRGDSAITPTAPRDPLEGARYEFQSPSRFTATVMNADGDPVIVVLTRHGFTWKVTDVRLPF